MRWKMSSYVYIKYVGGDYQNDPTYRADVWKCEWRNDENDQGTSPESYFIRDIINVRLVV